VLIKPALADSIDVDVKVSFNFLYCVFHNVTDVVIAVSHSVHYWFYRLSFIDKKAHGLRKYYE
jgi:hypothetical protein